MTNLSNLALFQALCHASVFMERKLVVDWVPSCDLEDSAGKEVSLLFGMKSILFLIGMNSILFLNGTSADPSEILLFCADS
jgi:CTP synthase